MQTWLRTIGNSRSEARTLLQLKLCKSSLDVKPEAGIEHALAARAHAADSRRYRGRPPHGTLLSSKLCSSGPHAIQSPSLIHSAIGALLPGPRLELHAATHQPSAANEHRQQS